MGAGFRQRLLRDGPVIRRWLLLAATAGVPLLFLRNINDPINVPKLGFLFIVVSVAAAIRLAERLQTRNDSGLRLMMVPAAALALPLFISWMLSPYRGWALWGIYPRLLGLLPYLVVIALGVLVADAFSGDPLPVAKALAAAGGIAALYGVVQWAGLDPLEWTLGGGELQEGIVVSTLGNPNFAGAFLAIALPLAVGLSFTEGEATWPWAAAVGLIVVGLVATRSEAAGAAAVAGLMIPAGFYFTRRWRPARTAAVVAVSGISLVVVGSVLAGIAGVAESRIPLTIQRRGDWWLAAVDMSAASPVVGRGPNAFALEHSQYRTAEDVRQVGLDITDDPHSVFLSFLTSAGVIGAIGYLIAVGWVVARARKVPSDDLFSAIFLGALTAYFIQSLVSIDTVALRTAGWTALAGLVAARAPVPSSNRMSRSKKKALRPEPLRALPAVGLLIVLASVGVWVGGRLILKDATFRHAGDLLREGQGQPALTAFEQADSFGNITYRRAYGNLLGDVAVGLGEDGEPYIARAREVFRFVYELPHVNAALDYADTLKNWAIVDPSTASEVVEAYELALSYDPIDTALISEYSTGLLELSTALLERRADAEAIAMLEPLVERFDQAALWGNLALAQARVGDEGAAKESAARALTLDPSNTAALEAQAILESAPTSP